MVRSDDVLADLLDGARAQGLVEYAELDEEMVVVVIGTSVYRLSRSRGQAFLEGIMRTSRDAGDAARDERGEDSAETG